MKILSLLVLGFWSLTATAQVPVVEAGRATTVAAQAAGGNQELVVTLYNQLEALQQEVQTLRGIVEEQAFQLRRMETEQRDRYVDIDRRLSGATQGSTPGGISLPGQIPQVQQDAGGADGSFTPLPAFNTSVPDSGQPSATGSNQTPVQIDQPAAASTAPAVAQMDEQDLYRTSLALLLEQNQYEDSIQFFQSYIDRFPQGRYLTNAYYWQGEALLLVSRHNEARDVFNKILTDYPQDPKAAGAMLKLGVAYQQMGDAARAASTWQEISTRYPENLTEIGFAQDYLNKL